ncbi:GIY-YIG nuclease family protein [Clostridium sp. JNZ J1-5]
MSDIGKRIKLNEFKKKIGLNEDLEINNGDSGVYIIYSVATDWCYVGETGDLNTRYKYHISALRNNRHNRRKLQEIFNEFGKEDLEYVPVYKCPEFMRKHIERAYTYELGLKTVNVESADKGFTWETIDREKIMMDMIPNKYRIILKVHKQWKFRDHNIEYKDYLSNMIKNGTEIKEKGFKWLDEVESYNNLKLIERYTNNYNNFTQIALDYIAVAILNDILGREDNNDVFYKGRIKHENNFDSDDLIYNIYKKIREDNVFRNDIVKASTSLISYKNEEYSCILEITKLFENTLKIENVFDLLYVYIINLFIQEIM